MYGISHIYVKCTDVHASLAWILSSKPPSRRGSEKVVSSFHSITWPPSAEISEYRHAAR